MSKSHFLIMYSVYFRDFVIYFENELFKKNARIKPFDPIRQCLYKCACLALGLPSDKLHFLCLSYVTMASRKKNLTNGERRGIFEYLLTQSQPNSYLKKGTIKEDVAVRFNVDQSTVYTVGYRGKQSQNMPLLYVCVDVKLRIKDSCGREKKERNIQNIIKGHLKICLSILDH